MCVSVCVCACVRACVCDKVVICFSRAMEAVFTSQFACTVSSKKNNDKYINREISCRSGCAGIIMIIMIKCSNITHAL